MCITSMCDIDELSLISANTKMTCTGKKSWLNRKFYWASSPKEIIHDGCLFFTMFNSIFTDLSILNFVIYVSKA